MDAVKLLGSLLNNNSTGGNILGSLLGAASGGSRGGSGLDVGGLLGSLMSGGGSGRSSGSGMGGNIAGAVLGSLLGGRSGSQSAGGGGAMMDILGGLMGGGGAASSASGLLSSVAPQAAADPQHTAPTSDPHTEAELLIRAMCNAAKSDGKFDEAEQKAILGRLGEDVDQAEIDFINTELSKPLDVHGFAKSVPAGLGQQVYAFSVMAIKLDEQSEARYLRDLAQGLGIDPASCNQIHEQLGAPKIFS
ncbi:MAG: DUF533 domain-containing protein [Verrucomicrobiales bacterium]